MIKNICILTITITTSLCGMETQLHKAIKIPSNKINETIRYEKTHLSPRASIKQKSFIEETQKERNHLKEKLEDTPECFWMWTPEDGAFHSLYKAENKDDAITITLHCNPTLRMGEYSILSSIILAPNISFKDKKEVMITLLSQNYIPTNADKKLNLLALWEQCTKKKIIKNIWLFMWGYNQGSSLQTLPQETVQSIIHLAFNTESLL